MATKRIRVNPGAAAKMAAHFNVSVQTIRAALRYVTEGDMPDAYRKEAVENYGGRIFIENPKAKV